jgi:hypothetical protein
LSLNVSNNCLVQESGPTEPSRQGLKKGDLADGKIVTTVFDNGNIRTTDVSGIIAFAGAIEDNGALSVLSLEKNDLVLVVARL